MRLAAWTLCLARLCYDKKDRDAVQMYEELIERAPGFGHLYNLLAIAHIEFGRLRPGLDTLDGVVASKHHPEVAATAYLLRGMALNRLGRVDEAKVWRERAMWDRPETPANVSREVWRLLPMVEMDLDELVRIRQMS